MYVHTAYEKEGCNLLRHIVRSTGIEVDYSFISLSMYIVNIGTLTRSIVDSLCQQPANAILSNLVLVAVVITVVIVIRDKAITVDNMIAIMQWWAAKLVLYQLIFETLANTCQ